MKKTNLDRWVSINGELYKENLWGEVIPRDFQ